MTGKEILWGNIFHKNQIRAVKQEECSINLRAYIFRMISCSDLKQCSCVGMAEAD